MNGDNYLEDLLNSLKDDDTKTESFNRSKILYYTKILFKILIFRIFS